MKKYIIISITSISFLSCTSLTQMDLKESSTQLVVNATLCPDSLISLTLSKSKKISDESNPDYIDNSTILVYENAILADTLKNLGNGKYAGDLAPKSLTPYTIKVITSDNQIVTGTDSIPECVSIQAIDTSEVTGTNRQILKCGIHFKDPKTQNNYYLIKILSSVNSDPQTLLDQTYTCYDSNITGTLNDGNIVVFDDSNFNGKEHTILVSMDFPSHKTIYFQLWTISPTFYNYCTSIIQNRTNNGSLFSDPTMIRSNINGGLGIIGAYALSKDSIHFD